jgi:hypothetical protein
MSEVEIGHIVRGAIWRRKKTGALLRITRAADVSTLSSPPYYDVSWETVEKPIRRGISYQDYWLKNCEPVSLPPEVKL